MTVEPWQLMLHRSLRWTLHAHQIVYSLSAVTTSNMTSSRNSLFQLAVSLCHIGTNLPHEVILFSLKIHKKLTNNFTLLCRQWIVGWCSTRVLITWLCQQTTADGNHFHSDTPQCLHNAWQGCSEPYKEHSLKKLRGNHIKDSFS